MKTFEEYVSGISVQYGSLNLHFEAGMYSLLTDLNRVVTLLRSAGISFEVIGGVAVNAHLLAANQRGRTFVTRDIDLLVERSALPKIIEAADANGYRAKKMVGGYALIRPDQSLSEAVHMVFAGEKSKSTQPLEHPQINACELDVFEVKVPVVELADLVRMKLTSFRPKDLVHLQILDDAGLITRELESQLPQVLSDRLQEARQQFERDEPDVDE